LNICPICLILLGFLVSRPGIEPGRSWTSIIQKAWTKSLDIHYSPSSEKPEKEKSLDSHHSSS